MAGLTALGFYPSTQIFQVEDDEACGDRTLAVAMGPAGALRLGALCLAAAGAVAVAVLRRLGLPLHAAAVAGGYGLVVARHLLFAGRSGSREEAWRWATRTRLWATAGFLALFAAAFAARV